MSNRILHVAQVGTTAFPRFAIRDHAGMHWDGTSWSCRPLIYSDQSFASNDCFKLQRMEAVRKKVHAVVEVPLRIEAFADSHIEKDLLLNWLCKNVHVEIDVSSGFGSGSEGIVIGAINWPRTTIQVVSTE